MCILRFLAWLVRWDELRSKPHQIAVDAMMFLTLWTVYPPLFGELWMMGVDGTIAARINAFAPNFVLGWIFVGRAERYYDLQWDPKHASWQKRFRQRTLMQAAVNIPIQAIIYLITWWNGQATWEMIFAAWGFTLLFYPLAALVSSPMRQWLESRSERMLGIAHRPILRGMPGIPGVVTPRASPLLKNCD